MALGHAGLGLGAQEEEDTMRSPVNFASLPDILRPGKGYHGEQTTFFGREARSNFSLLPVNLWLRRHSMREGRRAGGGS